MIMDYATRQAILEDINEMLPQVLERAKSSIERLVNCGGYDPESEAEIALKAIVHVAVKEAAMQMHPLSDDCKALVENLEHF